MSKLFEGIIGTGAQPKYFWLALDIPNWGKDSDSHVSVLHDIGQGKLTGLKGISDSREIVTEWFMIARNAVIIMDSNEVIRENDIEKITYDDPDGLCANNLAMVFRLFDKRRDKNGYYGIMVNLSDRLGPILNKATDSIGHLLVHYGLPSMFDDYLKQEDMNVETAHDLAKWMWAALKAYETKQRYVDIERELDFDMFALCVRQMLMRVGQMYASESEWVVHSDSFHIPRNSRMIVGIDMAVRERYEEWLALGRPDTIDWAPWEWRLNAYDKLMTRIKENRLEDYYKIVYVDGRRFEEIRPKVMVRRREKSRPPE